MRTARPPELLPRFRPWFWSLVVGSCCWVGWAGTARAAGAPRAVVMVVDQNALPLALRLRQEIESLGLVVKWISPETASVPSLEQEAKTAGAVASIRIAPMGGGDVDMTIFDRTTGKTVSWKLVAAGSADAASAELIATRSVELLRASLEEMAARRPPAEPAPVAARSAPPATAKAPDHGQSLGVMVGPAILYSSDFRLGTHVLSTITWMPFFRAGLSASLLAPVTPARLITAEGKVQAFATLYRLGAVLEVTRPKSPVSLRLTAALAIGELHIAGNTSAPYVSASDTHYVACPSLGMTTRFVLTPGVNLFADVAGQVAFPKTVIRVVGRETTDWGRPALSAALGLEVAWYGGSP